MKDLNLKAIREELAQALSGSFDEGREIAMCGAGIAARMCFETRKNV